jgi:hypothetical protein
MARFCLSVAAVDSLPDFGGGETSPAGAAGRRVASACETEGVHVIGALIAAGVVFLIATFPATWLLMLFLGNVGVSVSYGGALPLGILVSALLAGSSSRTSVRIR